jgi:hypothetical protein
MFKWLQQLLSRLFSKKSTNWDSLNYGKPSAAGDDFRKNNEA